MHVKTVCVWLQHENYGPYITQPTSITVLNKQLLQVAFYLPFQTNWSA